MIYKGITHEKVKNPEFPSRQTWGKYELSVDECGEVASRKDSETKQ